MNRTEIEPIVKELREKILAGATAEIGKTLKETCPHCDNKLTVKDRTEFAINLRCETHQVKTKLKKLLGTNFEGVRLTYYVAPK